MGRGSGSASSDESSMMGSSVVAVLPAVSSLEVEAKATEVEGEEAPGVVFAIEVRESGEVDSGDYRTIVSSLLLPEKVLTPSSSPIASISEQSSMLDNPVSAPFPGAKYRESFVFFALENLSPD